MKSDPFHIRGPAVISFSGGRTSAYMLHRILERGLEPDVHILFCNTGREDDRTLDFVNACSRATQVPIHWLEYRRRYLPKYKSADVAAIAKRLRAHFGLEDYFEEAKGRTEPGFEEVSYEAAARIRDNTGPVLSSRSQHPASISSALLAVVVTSAAPTCARPVAFKSSVS